MIFFYINKIINKYFEMLVFENLILGVEYSVLSICIKYLELYFPVIFKSI